ncbi:MAG: hypothetical protein AABO41_17745 [Acidobacteriota bacterium]
MLPNETKPQPIPDNERVPLTKSEDKSVKGLGGGPGCVLWGVICVVVGALSQSPLLGIVVASLAVAVIAVGIKNSRSADLEREKAQQARKSVEYANQSAAQRVVSEAASLTSRLATTYELSTSLATELPKYLTHAASFLRNAEAEYQDNAFGPFWDAVENAAKNLAAFNDKVNKLSGNAAEYYRMLDGRKHTFPAFPANIRTLPDPSAVLNDLRRIVRMGQTNFQFANIWEHRRTRDVLIAGFRTLGDAVNNLGATIEYSVSSLQDSVSSGLAKVVEEEIRTRDALDKRLMEQNRMLDNIQSHREPDTTDRPSRY